MSPIPKTPTLPSYLEEAIEEHLKRVHRAIVHRAQELSLQDARKLALSQVLESDEDLEITPSQCLRAIEEIAPGVPTNNAGLRPLTFWERFLESVSPITLICSILTIAFAAFGLVIIHSEGKGEINPSAYLDIAKIFAGAIVGSASVSIARSSRGGDRR